MSLTTGGLRVCYSMLRLPLKPEQGRRWWSKRCWLIINSNLPCSVLNLFAHYMVAPWGRDTIVTPGFRSAQVVIQRTLNAQHYISDILPASCWGPASPPIISQSNIIKHQFWPSADLLDLEGQFQQLWVYSLQEGTASAQRCSKSSLVSWLEAVPHATVMWPAVYWCCQLCHPFDLTL